MEHREKLLQTQKAKTVEGYKTSSFLALFIKTNSSFLCVLRVSVVQIYVYRFMLDKLAYYICRMEIARVGASLQPVVDFASSVVYCFT